MACNVVNFLKDFKADSNTLEICKHGLGYSKAGDCLNDSDWQLLYYAPNKTVFVQIVDALLPKYESLAKILEYPKSAEEWYTKVWGSGFLKTRRKKAYNEIYQKRIGEYWNNIYYSIS